MIHTAQYTYESHDLDILVTSVTSLEKSSIVIECFTSEVVVPVKELQLPEFLKFHSC